APAGAGQPQRDHVFGFQLLCAEATADVGRAHVHALDLNTKKMGDLLARMKHVLDRSKQVNVFTTKLGKTAADVLHRMMEDGREGIAVLEHAVGLFEALIDVAPTPAVLAGQI